MKIDFFAADSNLIAAPDGAIATVRFDDSDEIVGYVMNHTSADGYTVSTFSAYVDGIDMPVVVMNKDDPKVHYEVINEKVEDFYAVRSRGRHVGFFRQICDHHGWGYDIAAALNGAYWLSKRFANRITNNDLIEANAIVKGSRELFYSYAEAIQI